MARHVHCDSIKAWADDTSLEIEFKNASGQWVITNPTWNPGMEYRIKPRIVKREGWVAICRNPGEKSHVAPYIYNSKKYAQEDSQVMQGVIAITQLEWEETE